MFPLLRLWGRLPIPNRLRWAIISLFVPKFAVGVVGVIFNEEKDILMFHHTYRGSRYPWGLPSGWLAPREDPVRAIVREIYEETGLDVCVVRPLLIENAFLFRRLDLFFLCEYEGGEFRPSSEVDATQFFNKDSLPEMLLSQREMIEKILDLLENPVIND
jgi:ADP-ribose pyrophosphatase YjhB (NUDIX family)